MSVSRIILACAMALSMSVMACAKKIYTVMTDTALVQNPDDKKPTKVAGGEVKRGETLTLIEEKNFGGKKFLMVQIDKVTTKGWIDAGSVSLGKLTSATILRDTDFYSRPSLKSPKSGKAKAGVVVFVLSTEEQFAKVQSPGGEGYIEKVNLGDANSVIRSVNIPGLGAAVVSASSTYKSTEGKEAEYDVRNLFDGGIKTGWCEGKDDDNGVGETITISFGKTVHLDSVSVVNGLALSEASYNNNNRVKDLTVSGSDRGQALLTLDDKIIDFQERNMSSDTIEGSAFTFRIDGIHGGKVKDTCISEIKITGTEVSNSGYGGGYGH